MGIYYGQTTLLRESSRERVAVEVETPAGFFHPCALVVAATTIASSVHFNFTRPTDRRKI
jgi:hypothetical protein